MVKKMNNLDKLLYYTEYFKYLKIFTYVPLILFYLIMYLGIQGYKNPNSILIDICLFSFILFILSLIIIYIPSYILEFIRELKKHSDDENIKEKDKKSKSKIIIEYSYPIIVLLILYFWGTSVNYEAPLYGKGKIYNIFYRFGYGSENLNINNNQTGGGNNSIILIFYRFVLTLISIITYIYGLLWPFKYISNDLWPDKTGLSIPALSADTIFLTTIVKCILGYVPRYEDLHGDYISYKNYKPYGNRYNKNSKLFKFLQYRVYENTWISKLAALIRRFTSLGLDMDALDEKITLYSYCKCNVEYCNEKYNNIFGLDKKNYNENAMDYIEKKFDEKVSFMERWKWETSPYLFHWIAISSIGSIILPIWETSSYLFHWIGILSIGIIILPILYFFIFKF